MGHEDNTDTEQNNADYSNEENQPLNEDKNCNRGYLRTKMEAMQKRIDELKEKVQYEGGILHSEGGSLKSGTFDEKHSDSFSDLQNISEKSSSGNENNSDKSLYFSASNNSLCSISTSSTEIAYYNFKKFVNGFLKDQNQKERLSLLQFHSNKQISLNMMRHSLSDLSSRCSEELELIGTSLQHLNRLAAEFSVNVEQCHRSDKFERKALEYKSADDVANSEHETRNSQNVVLPQLKGSGIQVDGSNNPMLATTDAEDNICFL